MDQKTIIETNYYNFFYKQVNQQHIGLNQNNHKLLTEKTFSNNQKFQIHNLKVSLININITRKDHTEKYPIFQNQIMDSSLTNSISLFRRWR